MWINQSKVEAGMRHDGEQPVLVSTLKFFFPSITYAVFCQGSFTREKAVLLFFRNEKNFIIKDVWYKCTRAFILCVYFSQIVKLSVLLCIFCTNCNSNSYRRCTFKSRTFYGWY